MVAAFGVESRSTTAIPSRIEEKGIEEEAGPRGYENGKTYSALVLATGGIRAVDGFFDYSYVGTSPAGFFFSFPFFFFGVPIARFFGISRRNSMLTVAPLAFT